MQDTTLTRLLLVTVRYANPEESNAPAPTTLIALTLLLYSTRAPCADIRCDF